MIVRTLSYVDAEIKYDVSFVVYWAGVSVRLL